MEALAEPVAHFNSSTRPGNFSLERYCALVAHLSPRGCFFGGLGVLLRIFLPI